MACLHILVFSDWQSILTLILMINDMKCIYKKLCKSKKPSLDSVHAPEPEIKNSWFYEEMGGGNWERI